MLDGWRCLLIAAGWGLLSAGGCRSGEPACPCDGASSCRHPVDSGPTDLDAADDAHGDSGVGPVWDGGFPWLDGALPRLDGALPRVDGGFSGQWPSAAEQRVRLGRGINFANMLEVPPTPDGRPGEGDWDLWVEQIYLQVVKVVGFDSIRLPLCWSCYTGDEPPYAIESRYFERVDEVVRWALEVDLAVVLVMHSYWQMNVHPADHRQRYLALWRQIARHYWDWSPDLMFELLDEPGASMEADDWNALLPSVVAVVRESNPERTLIVGPAARNSVTALEQLQLPVDNHLVATVHLFEPQTFTHSGLAYLGHLPPGATWTGSAAEREALEGLLDQAQRFASSKGVPLYVGEFGSSVYADGASRLRYTAFVVGAMAAREMAWAYWDFGGWFRVYDCFNHHHAPDSTFQGTGWNEPLLSALLDT